MGCSGSTEIDSNNQRIEEELRKERKLLKNEVKILLLGAGESGKSTVVKQMRLLYSEPYSELERERFTSVICTNTLQSMQTVLAGTRTLEIPLPAHLESVGNLILSTDPIIFENNLGFEQELSRALFLLWRDPVIKQLVERGNELQLNDSAVYFFDSIARIGTIGYKPTDQDILRTRVRSTGIVEEKFIIENSLLRVIDVGGQRSERKKWIHCFEGVNVVLFVAAISEYDQMLWEDESFNRLDESIAVFESVISSRWFIKTSFILFLNKIDIFQSKLQVHPLEEFCQDYVGNTEDDACRYMQQKFLAKAINRDEIYSHFTCATDSSQVQVVISAVANTILKGNLAHVGML